MKASQSDSNGTNLEKWSLTAPPSRHLLSKYPSFSLFRKTSARDMLASSALSTKNFSLFTTRRSCCPSPALGWVASTGLNCCSSPGCVVEIPPGCSPERSKGYIGSPKAKVLDLNLSLRSGTLICQTDPLGF